MYIYIYVYVYMYILYINVYIRRPLPSLGPGGAAPGITAGVRLWPARTSACMVHQTPNPLPLPSQVTEHVALQQQSFASAWPVAILHLEGFKTCAKHGPSRHKTPLWAFTALSFKTCAKHGPSRHKTPLWAFAALPLPSQVTANTLPCSSSPLPAPGHVAILHLEGFKTCAKHGQSRHKTRLWAFTALPLPSAQTRCPAAAVLCQRLHGQSPYSI